MNYLKYKRQDFKAFFRIVKDLIVKNYGISVNITKLQGKRTGEFNGKNINVDMSQTSEEQLFLLLHLFGHNIQWSISHYWKALGLKQPRLDQFENYRVELLKKIDEIYLYEKQASRYGLALLHQCGILSLDQWLSDWFNADWTFLNEVYHNGYKEELTQNFKKKYFKPFSEKLFPLNIPVFKVVEWDYRFAF